MLPPSAGWLCHRALRSCCISSLGTAHSFMKLTAQKVLDPMDLCRNVTRRVPCNLSDRGRVHSFQIEKDHLLVVRLEPLNQRPQSIQRFLLIERQLAVVMTGHFDFIEADKRGAPRFPPDDNRCGGVVRDAIDPGLQGASPFETFKTLP